MEKINKDLFIDLAIGHAQIERLDDGNFYAEIPGFSGVMAVGDDMASCLLQLKSVLSEWIGLHQRDGNPLPALNQGSLELRLA